MEFDDVINVRHSVRAYSDKQVDRALLTELVSQAIKSPSWVNSQPWKVYIATGDTMRRLADQQADLESRDVQSHPDIPVQHRELWEAPQQANMQENSKRRAEWGTEHGVSYPESQRHLYNAPAVAYLTIAQSSPQWSLYDLGNFAEALILAATNKGLGTIPSYSLVKYPELARQALGIPENELLVIGIAIGYPATSPMNDYRSKRMALDQILTISD